MSDFARNVKRRRAERGMSQEQLAEKLGVTRQTVSNWERSVSFPELPTLELIARTLDTDPASLIYPERKAVPELSGGLYMLAAVLLYIVLLFFGGLLTLKIFDAMGMVESVGEAFILWGLVLLAAFVAANHRR